MTRVPLSGRNVRLEFVVTASPFFCFRRGAPTIEVVPNLGSASVRRIGCPSGTDLRKA
jgi:hypothetical protein